MAIEKQTTNIINGTKTMTYQEAKKIIGNQPIWAIKNMIEVLSLPISKFLNTDKDNERLQAGKIILKGNK